MAVQNDVASYFKPYGLNIEKLFYAGTIRMPEQVRDQINQRIANEQAALAAQANVATATANAQAKIEAPRATPQANQLIANSIHANPEIVQLRAIEKWNGVLPVYTGGAGRCRSSRVASRRVGHVGHHLPQPQLRHLAQCAGGLQGAGRPPGGRVPEGRLVRSPASADFFGRMGASHAICCG